MNSTFDLKFRKEKRGPELDLVNNFLKCSQQLFNNQGFEVTPLLEPYAEVGIPDILLIFWDKDLCKSWVPERNNLTKRDIKVLHYISTFGKRGVKTCEVSKRLNFEAQLLFKIIERLVESGLVEQIGKKVLVKELKRIFFIKKIISIEAKINDWKQAISQARINENFSSHSYVLLPAEKVNDNIISSFNGNTGLLLHDGKKPFVMKQAKKTKIPSSYYSWLLNEYLGRQYSQSI